MAYKVRITRLAENDAYVAYDHVREVTPEKVDRWLEELFKVINSLAEMPARCPLFLKRRSWNMRPASFSMESEPVFTG